MGSAQTVILPYGQPFGYAGQVTQRGDSKSAANKESTLNATGLNATRSAADSTPLSWDACSGDMPRSWATCSARACRRRREAVAST